MELFSLNDRQQSAVLHTEGPLLIVAGAGAGKTRVITHRIANLIQKGVHPEQILAVTFTNKAAREMRERVVALVGQTQNIPFVSTFHSFCVFLLREKAPLLGLSRWFTIYDRGESTSLIRRSLKALGYDPKSFDPHGILSAISRAKGDGVLLGEYRESVEDFYGQVVSETWERYEKELFEEQALDFDDLLVYAVRLLQREDVRAEYQSRFKYIHVDEYQDTNAIQYTLIKLLVGPEKNICVVGDMDQNIYSWRGARNNHLVLFEKEFPGTTVILLEENYRSTKTILAAANAIVQKNVNRHPKNLFTSRPDGEKIQTYSAFDEIDEASWIIERVSKLLSAGVRGSEIALLYRANFQSRVLEEMFIRAGIPYHVLGTAFFQRREVKEFLGFVRAALNPADKASIERIIGIGRKGIGEKTLEKVFRKELSDLSPRLQAEVGSFFALLEKIKGHIETKLPSEAMKEIFVISGLETFYLHSREEGEERLENLKELVSLSTKYDSLGARIGVEKLLEEASLASDQDALEDAKDGVRLMTVHAAKGLEFGYVFVTGLEQGLFPHEKMNERFPHDPEEERRLCYVAFTRAKEALYLSHASTRMVFGASRISMPSEFLTDVPSELIAENSPYKEASGATNYLGTVIDF